MQWGRHGRENTQNAIAKFLNKTKHGPDGCILWTGSVGSHGRYGSLSIAGKHWLAHRAAWFLFKGADPGEMVVCHSCDNGLCVNVDHLFLGTQADNIHDMESKQRSRHPSNENHGMAKLTNEQVFAIRELRKTGLSIQKIANIYGVSGPTIHRIVNGTGWKGV